jgi:hypothetical protein
MLPAVDRLGMPLVTSGQFAYVYKLKSPYTDSDVAVRCFRGYLGDRDQRYRAIQRHLETHPIAALSDFTYAPDGILVAGKRFPILFMNWINGPTLDLYLEEMISRKEVMLHLSQEWLRLIGSLREAGIAHGDLQHGNIIVEHGQLRLVDHDGLFVPEMNHWSSSEVGHQHYQHPLRDAQQFDSNLDNFSSIVIYLTLISLAERPGLWKEHHDENLLFTRADFLNPAASSLFGKIRELGVEQKRLSDVLADASKGSPRDVPYLMDIVNLKSALPAWMTQPVNLESRTKTREAKIAVSQRAQDPRWIPRQRSDAAAIPSSPQTATYQTLFGARVRSSVSNLKDPTAVWKNTPIFAKEMLGATFVWWYWGVYFLLTLFGFEFLPAFGLALSLLAVVSLIYGFVRARQVAQSARLKAAVQATAAPLTLLKQQANPPPPLPGNHRPVPSSVTANDPLVGNASLSIYHIADCDWVKHILNKNRITFSSAAEALSAGYKPCRVCSPTS